MNKIALALILVLLILVSIIGGALFVALTWDDKALGKLYTFPLSAGEETYIVTVRSNYSSTPELSYNAFPPFSAYYVSVDFRGDPEDSFCNITIPTDLIWGEICDFQVL